MITPVSSEVREIAQSMAEVSTSGICYVYERVDAVSPTRWWFRDIGRFDAVWRCVPGPN